MRAKQRRDERRRRQPAGEIRKRTGLEEEEEEEEEEEGAEPGGGRGEEEGEEAEEVHEENKRRSKLSLQTGSDPRGVFRPRPFRAMAGSGSAGNPSAATSRRLPARADEDTDCTSASEEDKRHGRESVILPGSQNHQSPAENHQSPAENHQSPAENHQSPAENHQSPAENHQSPAENHHSPAEKPDRLRLIEHRIHKHLVGEKDSQTKPDQQQLRDSQTSPARPDQSNPDPLPGEQQKTKDSPFPEIQPSPRSPPPLLKLHISEIKDQRNHQNPPSEKLPSASPERHQDHQAPPPYLNTEQAPPPLKTHQAPRPNLSTQQAPPPPHLNTQQAPPPYLNTEQAPSPPHINTQQAPPPPHLNTQQAPSPPQINTQQAPPPPHLNTQQTPPPSSTEVSTLAPPVQAPPLIKDQVGPRPPVSSSGDPKLCGFLQKQGGPLRAWKWRWFTYEEKKNQLFYYRTPQDVTPLGQVELCSATFTYPLQAERGTFHIRTPERTFILKATTQELMLYWLQQLQVKRWQHRRSSTCPEGNNNNNNNNNTAEGKAGSETADGFLPVLSGPLGLVGEQAAGRPARTPLANMSIKHPLIEIQNSVHSLRKRASQEWTQSALHADANPDSTSTSCHARSIAPVEAPPLALSLAEAGGQVTPTEGRDWPSLPDSRSKKTKNPLMVLCRDTLSSDRMSRLQQEKQVLLEDVRAQKELVWILHKALEASQLEKRSCAEFLAETGEQERLELLRHGERQAADLRGRLEDLKKEAEAAKAGLAQRDAHLAQLQEDIRMLQEKNDAKQQVIIKLSDQLTSCMTSDGGLNSQTFRRLQQEIENLKDDIEAYKTQNQFLNSEIHQLTNLWRTSSEQEKSLMGKCSYLEASHCQVESRYLGVLRQLQETPSLDPVQRGAVQKMIQEALKGELKTAVKLNVARDHDQYGFKIIPEYEVEDVKLLAKIQALEIRSHNLLHQDGAERPLLSRWAQFLASRSEDLCPSPELKALLRGGIPQEYRQQVWRWVVRARTRTIREHHPQRYQQLCEKSRTCSNSASRQIQLDLHRTLTTNQHFSSPSSPALQQLRRILLAFSWQNPAIGYCQGLNRLAAIALLVLQSEEDAFWCLVAVVEAIMPQDYYTKNLVASQADQRVLKDLLVEKLPRLAAHFEEHGIDVSLITFNWFLVLFVESLPSDILLPLWDAFLYEGTKVIFRYALALLKYKEDDILKIHDAVELYQYLRFFTKTISDGRRLTAIAFSDMNPFPGRLLRNRRALHLARLQGELRELEEQQREFVTESAERKDKELDAAVSEDDEEV
ncbi:TBC1 domain family member 2A [Clinocottus analis]|uniref:TBC1 domain family member 2A n=1 Tax=Clinocottus analis TaxID=304258 RepID=UPI0035BF0642